MAFSRRKFLMGVGGAMVGLPYLESLAPKGIKEADAANGTEPFALFYRRGNGVQQGLYDRNDYVNFPGGIRDPERWWPMQNASTPMPYGALTSFGSLSAIRELEAYVSKTTVVRGLRHPYGTENGHPEGAVQGLTGAGVKYLNDAPNFTNCEPLGESIDNMIARKLTPDNPESLYVGVKTSGATGVSYLKTGGTVFPRAAEENLLNIYNRIFLKAQAAADPGAAELLINRRNSVNDLVREGIQELRNDPRLSSSDRDRLDLHFTTIRDTELQIVAACTIPAGLQNQVQTHDAQSITARVEVIGKLAALAIACGLHRSVVVSIGIPQDIVVYNEVPGASGYEFHAISHRQQTEGNTAAFGGALDIHHAIDRYHLARFKSMLDVLASYPGSAAGESLLDRGVAVHFSDLGAGQHVVTRLPYLYVGGAAGRLKVGQYIDADKQYLVRFLNTIGAAMGCKNSAGTGWLDDFNADNNNYLTKNYCNFWYDVPYPGPVANGKPPITGRLASLIGTEPDPA